MPGGTAKFWLFEVSQGVASAAVALVGAVGLVLVAPWVTHAMATVDTAFGRRFLSLRPQEAVDRRVAQLETSRAAAVDSAEAERRRIERDLHDGAQQRLVALAVDLGNARERLEVDPEGGRALVAEAHEEAKAALKEIRDLVRGIHPVILEDRGLDAALSAIVARSPVPVRPRRRRGRAAVAGGREHRVLRGRRGARPTSPATPRPPRRRSTIVRPATASSSRCVTTGVGGATRGPAPASAGYETG